MPSKPRNLLFPSIVLLTLAGAGSVTNLTSCSTRNQTYSISDGAILPDAHKYQLFIDEPLNVDHKNTIVVDIAIPTNKPHPAVALILHGNHSKKEAHRRQIIALAKNGIAAIALQFKNTKHWYDNGILLAKIVPLLEKGILVQNQTLASNEIVLIGHSFGGYASAIAAGSSNKIRGLILLDPAMFDKRGPAYLARSTAPIIIIGADKSVFRSRKRDLFFEAAGTRSIELSVKGATHDDAQNPSMFALSSYGYDPYTTPRLQSLITELLVDSTKALISRYGMNHLESTLRDLERQEKISSIKIRSNSITNE